MRPVKTLVVTALFVGFCIFAPPAFAASITAIGGSGVVNNGFAFNGSSVPLDPGSVLTVPDAPPIFGGSFPTTLIGNSGLTVDLAGWNTNPGPVTLSPGTFTLTVITVGPGASGIALGDNVTFNITNPGQAQAGLFGFNILVPVTLGPVTGFSGHNFSPLANAYLSITFQVTAANPGTPGQIAGSSGSTYSWTITNQLPVIPEPGTLALFGLGLLGVAGVTLRRRRACLPPA